MNSKICSHCKIDKPLEDYYSNCGKCKKCKKEYRYARRDIHREYVSQRYKTDPRYKLCCLLRSRLQKVLKGISKCDNSLKLLGCTADEFRMYIENQFLPGMSWETHGLWEIDHIKPCNTFDLLLESEQRKCFHYTNCRPLRATDNGTRPKDGRDIGPRSQKAAI